MSTSPVVTLANGLLSPTECVRFLSLYGDALELGHANLALFALPTKQCFAAADPLQIRDRAMAWSAGSRVVYAHTSLHLLPPGEQATRGRIDTAAVAIGLFSDIDARGPKRGKPAEILCPTVADTLAVVEEFSQRYCRVSLVINSGHGCYPVLLFREPYQIQTDADRERLNALNRRNHEALRRIASAHGWGGAVDLCDLAKILRLPGTVNAKDPAVPVAVRIASVDPARYNISDLEEILPEIAAPRLFPARTPGTRVALANTGALGPAFEPPAEKVIAALTEVHPTFGATWNHVREDLNDQSCSGYDMALAGIGVACRMADAEIARLLVENRRRFPRHKQDRQGAHYTAYLERTIATARASQPDSLPIDGGCLDDPSGAPVDTPSESVRGNQAAGTGEDTHRELVESKGDDNGVGTERAAPVSTEPAPTPPVPEKKEQKPAPIVAIPKVTKKEVVKRVSDRLMADCHFARDAAERLYVYKNGIYVPADFFVRRKTQLILEEAGLACKWSSHHGLEVVQYTMLRAKELWAEPPLDEINLLNGILDCRDGKLRKHSPDFLSPIQIPVNYDAAAKCPAWDKFIGEVFPTDSVELAWEIVGDLITPDRSIQKAILLVGEGGNGKGVFLAGCIAFVGVINVSSVPLHKLESDRFAVSRLYGKLVNCCADLPSSDLESTSMFKALTGGDIITGERKYEHAFDFKPYARLLFSANHPPRSPDASKAFFDRWIVVPFDRSFRGTSRERSRKEIDGALADPKELSGLLNHVLPALQRVRATGRFMETESTKRALAEMQQVTDPLAVWLERETVTHPNASVPCGELLAAYNDDCAKHGRPPTSPTGFGLALRRLRPGIDVKKRGPKGNQHESYVGIGLKFDPDFPQGDDSDT